MFRPLPMTAPKVPIKTTPVSMDYDITRVELGSGISGKVLQCIQKSTGNKYAIKVLGDDAKALREVELHWRASNCPNIAKIVDVYENSNLTTKRNHLLIVMECLEGGELFNRIQSQKPRGFTEKDAALIVYQICTAIAHLHGMNIAHRDLKPENLLFTSDSPDATLKLIDFGFAKEVPLGCYLTSPCYTPYYAAPEVLGPNNYDKCCDIWSLGVITYILLCGYPPFYSQGGEPISPGMQCRIRQGQYTFPSSEWSAVSEEAKDLIRNLLIVEPDHRLKIEQVMQHPFIVKHRWAPQTPLSTVNVLTQQWEHWAEVEHGFQSALQSFRVKSSAPKLKELDESKNQLFLRRRMKALIEGAKPEIL